MSSVKNTDWRGWRGTPQNIQGLKKVDLYSYSYAALCVKMREGIIMVFKKKILNNMRCFLVAKVP